MAILARGDAVADHARSAGSSPALRFDCQITADVELGPANPGDVNAAAPERGPALSAGVTGEPGGTRAAREHRPLESGCDSARPWPVLANPQIVHFAIRGLSWHHLAVLSMGSGWSGDSSLDDLIADSDHAPHIVGSTEPRYGKEWSPAGVSVLAGCDERASRRDRSGRRGCGFGAVPRLKLQAGWRRVSTVRRPMKRASAISRQTGPGPAAEARRFRGT